MNLPKLFFTIILMIFFAWGIQGCGDDSPTGADMDDPPEVPTLDEVEMDFSVFEDAESFHASEHTLKNYEDFNIYDIIQQQPPQQERSYEAAAWFAWLAHTWFNSMAHLPSAFFNEALWGSGEFVDGHWRWEFSYSWEGESLSIVVTVEDRNGTRHWELRYTYSGEEHEDFEDALLVAAQVNLDGSGGAWQMFDLFDEEEPLFNIEYEFSNDITTAVNMQLHDEESFAYSRADETSSLTLYDSQTVEVYIEWNNETGVGFIEADSYYDGERVCWDEEGMNTPC